MNEERALKLFQSYTNGWKENNIKLITSCLEEKIIVIESHGPTYLSIQDIERWFQLWLEASSSVLKWDITSFYFCEKDQTAFCQWNFICVSNQIEYAFPGSSLVKFSDEKIGYIHEYRMTHAAFEWRGDKLQSE